MKKLIFTLLFVGLAIMSKSQTVVNVTTPGTLRATIVGMGIKPDTITNLTVTGTINAQDFLDIRDSTVADKVDLSGISIVAYTGKDAPEKPFLATTYPANTLPAASFSYTTTYRLTSIVLPSNLTAIGSRAFYHTNLQSITIPSNVTSLGAQAISGNALLETVVLPNAITAIGANAFIDDVKLVNINMPTSVTSVGNLAFKNCTSLTQLQFTGSSLTTIGTGFITSTGISTFTLPASVTTLDSLAFNGYGGTVTVDPANANYMSDSYGAVYNKDGTTLYWAPVNLTSFVIPSTVTKIVSKAFSNSKLTSVVIPASVQTIGTYAFSPCSKLATVDNSSATYKTIPDYAFQKDSALTSFTIPATVTRINQYAFNGSAINTISIPASVDSIQTNAFSQCYNLTSASFEAGSPLKSLGIRIFYNNPLLQSVTLPSNLDVIPDFAFSLCPKLTSVSMSSSLRAIKQSAFFSCSNLPSVTLPSTLKSIDKFAFDGCFKLASVGTIGASVDTIGVQAFTRTALNFVVDPANAKYSNNADGVLLNKAQTRLIQATKYISGSYTIPSSVTYIGTYAFYCDSVLTSVVIPAGVVRIDAYAFNNCTGITSVTANNPTPVTGTNMGTSVFSGFDIASCPLYVPMTSVSAYTGAAQWMAFDIQGVTSSIANSSNAKQTIYPRIVASDFKISNLSNATDVTVFDANGRKMLNTTSMGESIDVSSLEKGIYFVKFNGKVEKIVKK